MVEPLAADELATYRALVTAGGLLERAVAAQLAEFGLTPLQFSVLATLTDAPSGMRMRDLADALVHSRSGLTYQVAGLETRELVTRASSPGDDRGVVVALTAQGRELVLSALPGHIALVRRSFLDDLGADERTVLRETLEGVVERLRTR